MPVGVTDYNDNRSARGPVRISPHGSPQGRKRLLPVLLCGLIAGSPLATLGQTLEELKRLSLEELADIEVSIASRTPQRVGDTAAAVYVLTQEDIRRSGATSIPEALRFVPGLQVARITSNTWAISARGFNDVFSNKLLVLIDGRSVYTPLFSGVYWDVQDTLLEDIDRIEVIRGPGGSVWGANAVNGVINIITKAAAQTQARLASVTLGDEEAIAAGRFGAPAGDSGHYRVYAKAFDRDGARFPDGSEANDDWQATRIGFRWDNRPNSTDEVTIQGDAYEGKSGEDLQLMSMGIALSDEADLSGANLLARWKRTTTGGERWQVQTYYDRTERDDIRVLQAHETFDIELQHALARRGAHQLVWGLGYRRVKDRLGQGAAGLIQFVPERASKDTWSAFAQDEITLRPEELSLILGAKLEHNDFTGSELQPSVRALWHVNPRHSLWSALSRAVRTPSRLETDLIVVLPGTVLTASDNFDSEELIAWEVGYRGQLRPNLALDVAAYLNEYDRLGSVDPTGPTSFTLGNNVSARSKGIEVALDWDVTADWRLRIAYTRMDIDPTIEQPFSLAEVATGTFPDHQFQLRSLLNLGEHWELDTNLAYVDQLPENNVDSYTRLDIRLGWRPQRDWELSFVAQNLLDDRHREFEPVGAASGGGAGLVATEVERAYYLKSTWHF